MKDAQNDTHRIFMVNFAQQRRACGGWKLQRGRRRHPTNAFAEHMRNLQPRFRYATARDVRCCATPDLTYGRC